VGPFGGFSPLFPGFAMSIFDKNYGLDSVLEVFGYLFFFFPPLSQRFFLFSRGEFFSGLSVSLLSRDFPPVFRAIFRVHF